jgi:ribosome-associated toxin RatA of RatAB toxin-antitoxin module
MMRTVDEATIRAPLERVFQVAADVEGWPARLRHYRHVRMLERRPGGGVVEMAANRPFPLFNWPTWWVSDMWIEPERHAVRYRHIRGITTGMDVEWTMVARPDGAVDVTIVHEWTTGPGWPIIGMPAATLVIGPVFVHGIASRTLAGLKASLEAPVRA